MRSLFLVLLFTTACTTESNEAAKHDPAPAASAAAITHREADDKATEDEQRRNAAKADVATAQGATDAAASAAHVDIGAQIQKTFDVADRRFTALKEKVASAPAATKKRADPAMADATAREASVMAGIAKLRDASGTAWDATKTQIDSDTVALNQSLDSLDNTLK